MLSQALTKAAGRARTQKMQKVCGSNCMAIFVSVFYVSVFYVSTQRGRSIAHLTNFQCRVLNP